MGLPLYLAVTEPEYQNCSQLPQQLAWMACNFSSCHNGLTNIPVRLPEQSLLLVSDQFPPQGHDPALVAEQLSDAVSKLDAAGVVLDFQRPHNTETARIVLHIQDALHCPAAVTPTYLKDWTGGVFLPPVPVDVSAEEYLKPFSGREIWLEVDMLGEILTLTKSGCSRQTLTEPVCEPTFRDDCLCCHYNTRVLEDRAIFSLWRTREDMDSLLSKAQTSGARLAVGLYQQFY